MNVTSMIRKPSAFLPVAMSLLALALVVGHIVVVGTARQADEGIEAYLWQLLMAAQLPVIGYFVLRWLPSAPRQAMGVLAVQACAALAALAPVFILRW